MNQRLVAKAALPPPGITGLQPSWSRLVTVAQTDEVGRTWHILDSWAERLPLASTPRLTLLCVHGNPSWSFLWRKLLSEVPDTCRVIAVDQLDMGFSERTGRERNLALRIDDLWQLTHELALSGPVITVAHDWGGPVSLGWAQRHLESTKADAPTDVQVGKPYLAGVVLTNTAVQQPAQAKAPAVIRFIRQAALLKLITVNTRLFIKGAYAMSRPALSAAVREGFLAPYKRSAQRTAIADFVADIPLEAAHVSAPTLNAIAEGMTQLADTPVLLLWGPRDMVFSDLHLRDLEQRLPHADVHRYPDAAHFVGEDADVSGAIAAWIQPFVADDTSIADAHSAVPQLAKSFRALADFSLADEHSDAIVEPGTQPRRIRFGVLNTRVQQLASGMLAHGMQVGDRVAVMIMPGIELALVVYACWRAGLVVVLVDSGLGKKGMQRALRGAHPKYLIGTNKALLAARLLGWPGQRIAVQPASSARSKWLDIRTDLQALCSLGTPDPQLAWPQDEAMAALVFTSGSTGPSKGVLYQHRQIQAQRDALMKLYGITPADRLVAAFAPFALFGPTMGIGCMVPQMDVTRPGSLTATALNDAVASIDATLVFASPAALVNVVATRHALNPLSAAPRRVVRLVLSAGAPVRASLLESARKLFPNAGVHTPYGMTEVLPVADISLDQLQSVHNEHAITDDTTHAGVCVGVPVAGVVVTIDPLDMSGIPSGDETGKPGQLGEIIVRAAHARHQYDRLWQTHHMASLPHGVHRTGDVGQLDSSGRLWVGGRLGHVIVTAQGPLAPVAGEQLVEQLDGIAMAAMVGVGPAGMQAVVAVVQLDDRKIPVGEASLQLTDKVRVCCHALLDVASVLVVRQLPVDRRHNSKVDRTLLARWASRVLAGERVRSL